MLSNRLVRDHRVALRAISCEPPRPQTVRPGANSSADPVTVSLNTSLISQHFYERAHSDGLVLVEAGDHASALEACLRAGWRVRRYMVLGCSSSATPIVQRRVDHLRIQYPELLMARATERPCAPLQDAQTSAASLQALGALNGEHILYVAGRLFAGLSPLTGARRSLFIYLSGSQHGRSAVATLLPPTTLDHQSASIRPDPPRPPLQIPAPWAASILLPGVKHQHQRPQPRFPIATHCRVTPVPPQIQECTLRQLCITSLGRAPGSHLSQRLSSLLPRPPPQMYPQPRNSAGHHLSLRGLALELVPNLLLLLLPDQRRRLLCPPTVTITVVMYALSSEQDLSPTPYRHLHSLVPPSPVLPMPLLAPSTCHITRALPLFIPVIRPPLRTQEQLCTDLLAIWWRNPDMLQPLHSHPPPSAPSTPTPRPTVLNLHRPPVTAFSGHLM